MEAKAEIDEFAFLMDDTEFSTLMADLARRQEKIRKHSEHIEFKKTSIDRKVIEVCKVLLSDLNSLREYPIQHGEIRIFQLKEHYLKIIETASVQIKYDVEYGADATVHLNEFDSYEGEEGQDIMSFPISFIHRADWIAKLGILKEALILKSKRLQQEKEEKTAAAQKAKDLETLHNLLEKYKDQI